MKEKLDGIVLDIEFIIISVIQGVALTFLAEGAREAVGGLKYEYWFYIASGFLFILIFYSQAIIHALSFVRWPPDLGHNFLYFLASFAEVLAFTQMTNPQAWYALVSLFFLVAGGLYIYDFFIIKSLKSTFNHSPEAKNLYAHIFKQQRFELIYLVPSGLVFNLAAFILITKFPTLFLQSHLHVYLSAFQAIFSLLLLLNSVLSFKKRAQLITDATK